LLSVGITGSHYCLGQCVLSAAPKPALSPQRLAQTWTGDVHPISRRTSIQPGL